jgi:hypothetical protein
MIVVPSKTKEFLSIEADWLTILSKASAFFTTGTD